MAVPTSSLPGVGVDARSISDQKIYNALAELQTILTGAADTTNLAAGAVAATNLASALNAILGVSDATVRRGRVSNGSENLPTGAFGTGISTLAATNCASMPTPDKVSAVTVPANGLLLVDYVAHLSATTLSTSGADVSAAMGLFVGGNLIQLELPGMVAQGKNYTNGSGPAGAKVAFVGNADFAVSPNTSNFAAGSFAALPATSIAVARQTALGTPPVILYNLAAGSYDVEVKWVRNTSSASAATLDKRELRVWTIGF